MVAASALGRLTDDQRALRDAVRTLVRARVAPRTAVVPALSAAIRALAG